MARAMSEGQIRHAATRTVSRKKRATDREVEVAKVAFFGHVKKCLRCYRAWWTVMGQLPEKDKLCKIGGDRYRVWWEIEES